MINHINQVINYTQSVKKSKNTPKNHVPFHKNHCKTGIRCKKCLDDITRRGTRAKKFQSTASLTKHILKVHSDEKDQQYARFDIFLVLEQIAVALENNVPISTISKVREWKIEVK